MRIRIESNGIHFDTTLSSWLETLGSVAENDAEFAAVLDCMLDESRIRLLPEQQLAA